jgi:uncharacterized protein YbjQ (UPF0145 family)
MDDDTTDDGKIVHPKKAAFLAAYAVCGVIGKAADASGVGRNCHARWMEDEDYAKAFSDAQEQAVEVLEAEARRRATDGLVRFKFHQGEPVKHPVTGEPYYELEYSDTLLIFLLKGARPEKYRERMDIHGQIEGAASIVETIIPRRGDESASVASGVPG